MATYDYDLLTVGGGLGGAALAKVMAEAGTRVLVLEQEPKFRDRVRGEFLAPWGVAEAWQLGIADLFQQCGCDVPSVEMGMGRPRDLPSTTPHGLAAMASAIQNFRKRSFRPRQPLAHTSGVESWSRPSSQVTRRECTSA